MAALLHDIGKGGPGEHCAEGARLSEAVAGRWGFPAADAALIGRAVALHLLIPELATTRDLDDQATVRELVEAVGSLSLLEILAVLAQADAHATGPAAATRWRLALMADLVARARRS